MQKNCIHFHEEMVCEKIYQPDFCDETCKDFEDCDQLKNDLQQILNTLNISIDCIEKGFIDESLLHINMAKVYVNKIMEK